MFWTQGRRLALESLFRLILEEFDPLLSGDLWLDLDNPLHNWFLGFLRGYYQLYCNLFVNS
jgi:hypothetical protein